MQRGQEFKGEQNIVSTSGNGQESETDMVMLPRGIAISDLAFKPQFPHLLKEAAPCLTETTSAVTNMDHSST